MLALDRAPANILGHVENLWESDSQLIGDLGLQSARKGGPELSQGAPNVATSAPNAALGEWVGMGRAWDVISACAASTSHSGISILAVLWNHCCQLPSGAALPTSTAEG